MLILGLWRQYRAVDPKVEGETSQCCLSGLDFLHAGRREREGTNSQSQLDSATIRDEVIRARGAQDKRFGDGQIMINSRMAHKQVREYCKLDDSSEMLLKLAMTEFGLSARAHDKICKVARTIADLAQAKDIAPEHIAEAISYRKLDRKL